jgi:hypothetical protein
MEVSGGVLLAGDPWPAIRTLLSDPRDWLPLPATPRGHSRWLITVRGGPALHAALAEVGEPDDDDGTVIRSLRWAPRSGAKDAVGRFLPRFDGHIDLRAVDATASILSLTGVYEPPGGWVGATVDRAVLHKIAEGTVLERLGSGAVDLALVAE